MNQTFENFELIIVCDPSTDNSNYIISKFTDKRIRIFYRDEIGPGGYDSRNLGIRNSKAEWIAFLDADDEWATNHLELASIKILKYNVNFISFSFNVTGARSFQNKVRTVCNYKDLLLSKKEVLTLLRYKDVFHTNAVLIKKSTFVKIPFYVPFKTRDLSKEEHRALGGIPPKALCGRNSL